MVQVAPLGGAVVPNDPLIPTIVPIGPEVGVVWIFELLTTKLAEAESPLLPVTVITYVPGGTEDETVKDGAGFKVPVPLTVQAEGLVIMLAGLLVIVQVASIGLKPLPETVTDTPGGP